MNAVTSFNDQIFDAICSFDDDTIGTDRVYDMAMLDLGDLVCTQSSSWALLTPDVEPLLMVEAPDVEPMVAAPCDVPTLEVPCDEPAAFESHIQNDPLSPPSCASPKSITSMLLSPVASAKRSKPKAFRATKPNGTKIAGDARPVAPTQLAAAAAGGESRDDEAVLGSVPSDSEVASDEAEAAAPTPTTQLPASASDDEEKRKQRMLRNRASAAESRKRKRQQLEEYETLVASLTDTAKKLRQQNDELRRACALAGRTLETPALQLPPVNMAAGA